MEDIIGIPVVEVEVSAAHQSRIPLLLGHPLLGKHLQFPKPEIKATRKTLNTVFDAEKPTILLRIVRMKWYPDEEVDLI